MNTTSLHPPLPVRPARRPDDRTRRHQAAHGAGVEGRAEPVAAFHSVICAGDATSTDDTARRQAARLCSPGGEVATVSASSLTRHGPRALHDRCEGHDLLALGAGAAALTAVQHAAIPVLVARMCPPGTEVTDTIVVSVDDSPGSIAAVELAGRLVAANGGTVTILATPPRDAAFERAIAASFRVLLQATGVIPRVSGEPQPPERAIPSAAVRLSASLVLLGCGGTESERTSVSLVVGAMGCSVLTVPAPTRDL